MFLPSHRNECAQVAYCEGDRRWAEAALTPLAKASEQEGVITDSFRIVGRR